MNLIGCFLHVLFAIVNIGLLKVNNKRQSLARSVVSHWCSVKRGMHNKLIWGCSEMKVLWQKNQSRSLHKSPTDAEVGISYL